MPLLILNLNSIKWVWKIGYPYFSIWDRLDWERAVITTTLFSITNGGGRVIHPSIKSWNNPGNISLPWDRLDWEPAVITTTLFSITNGGE